MVHCRITIDSSRVRVAVMPFARVGQRGLSHGKSHAGSLSPLPPVRGFGHAPSSIERYTGGKFEAGTPKNQIEALVFGLDSEFDIDGTYV